MDVLSLCPLPAAPLIWQPAPSRWALTLVCKATYRLEPGIAALAAEQEPILARETHWDDDPDRSVVAPADLVPMKPRADVVLVGNAYARNGQPVRSLTVRMNVGKVDKSIEVLCARLRTREGELREGKRWTKMPLYWERAAGGPDTDNPVGLSREGPRDPYGQVPLPNLQPPGLGEAGDRLVPPIGFGPIAESWPPRKSKAAYVEEDRDYVKMPFGEGFEMAFFQVAPPDQQVDAIRPNERIALENLHPKHALLVTNLPGIQPRARVELHGAATREVNLVGDTLWIDTARSVCTVTFRARVDLERKDQDGRILVATSKADQTINWARIAPAPMAPRAASVIPPAAPSRPPPLSPSTPPPPAQLLPGAAALPAKVPLPPPPPPRVEDADSEIDPDLLESVEITMSENLAGQFEQTAALRPITSQPAVLPNEGAALPFQPPKPGWLPPASIPSKPISALPEWFDGHGSQVPSDQAATLDLPVWTGSRAAAPPPPLVAPPAIAPPLLAPPPMAPPPSVIPPPPPPPVLAPVPSSAMPPPPPPVISPPVLLGAPPEAAFSALEASNAAARANEAPAVSPAPRAETEKQASAVAAAPVIELIWFDAAGVQRVAASPVLAQAKRPGPAGKAPGGPPEANALEELLRAQVYEAMTRGAPWAIHELDGALDAAEEESPPASAVVVVAGTLELCLDEVEMLKAVVAAAAPLASSDKKLKELLDHANEMLKAPLQGMPDFVEGLSARIREAWTKANRQMPPEHLATSTERLLLEQRCYQKREILDDTWIRALLTSPGGEPAVPAYLPAKIAKRLPLYRRFPARLLAEVIWPQDQYETHPLALRALALGRLPARARPSARRRRM